MMWKYRKSYQVRNLNGYVALKNMCGGGVGGGGGVDTNRTSESVKERI
jgi:hypothetical protein